MARKITRSVSQAPGADWFLPEWMATLRVTQAELMRLTGWSKATTNDIFHGRTEYYRELINTVSAALKVEPFELLMPPERAMSLRSFRQDALRVAEAEVAYRSEVA